VVLPIAGLSPSRGSQADQAGKITVGGRRCLSVVVTGQELEPRPQTTAKATAKTTTAVAAFITRRSLMARSWRADTARKRRRRSKRVGVSGRRSSAGSAGSRRNERPSEAVGLVSRWEVAHGHDGSLCNDGSLGPDG
jgi:hypothetical protein